MLDKKSKQILKIINKQTTNISDIESSNYLLQYVPKTYDLDLLESVLYNLKSLEYIKFRKLDNIEAISPTYKGRNYFELSILEIKQFLIKSILVPIIVSMITTTMALFIKNLF